MTAWSDKRIAEGKTVALVPTMGFFHEGHLSLMRMAKRHADCVVVSLFVNPIQFGPDEDFEQYPRDLERDAAMAEQEGVDLLFAPDVQAMYPEEARTKVSVAGVTDVLCGKDRPGHFDGVTTVVAKLFNIVRPGIAVFGKKDLQQFTVIRRMVYDLNWDITILGHPIVREADGLAMSSRNSYLSSEERTSALCLNKAIRTAGRSAQAGLRDAGKLRADARSFIESHPGVSIQYISLVDRHDLSEKNVIDNDSVLALAVKVGRTRLIDNGELFEKN